MATDAGPAGSDLLAEAHDESTYGSHTPGSRIADKEDADTCRICRGEATAEEPLFYPCKCSGSIKYVHQECLMEWLSHTQKKHCELCKTPFRFTKLYHPKMPNHIPATVFARRAALHTVNMILTWCRGMLVACVWLLLLPWCMRVVWRSLFWVGDGGWSQDVFLDHLQDVRTNSNTAAHPNSTHQTVSHGPFQSLFYPHANASAGDWSIWWFVAHLLLPTSLVFHDLDASAMNATVDSLGVRSPSLLSEVPFFKWFDSQTANRFIIDVLEGQIITLLVVVAFILVFLIREWVVQQQPVINMAALGINAAANAAGNQDMAELEVEPAELEPQEDVDEPEEQLHDGEDQVLETELPQADRPRPRRSPSLDRRRREFIRLLQTDEMPDEMRRAITSGSTEDIARMLVDLGLGDSAGLSEALHKVLYDAESTDGQAITNEVEASSASSSAAPMDAPAQSRSISQAAREVDTEFAESSQRPLMPSRDRSFMATGINRSLEEGNNWSFESLPHTAQNSTDARDVPESWENEVESGQPALSGKQSIGDQEQGSDHSSESWQQVAAELDSDQVLEGGAPQATIEVETTRNSGTGVSRRSSTSSLGEVTPETTEETEFRVQPEDAESSMGSVHGSAVRSEDDEQSQPGENTENAGEVEEQRPQDAAGQAQADQPVSEAILDWIFGDIAPGDQAAEDPTNDEHIVRNLENEAPFVPVAANEAQPAANALAQDPEVAAAAAQAGIDVNEQEAIEDAEDIEGILELIGMQGPLVGLFQNVIFSAILISATLACAVWIPYLLGKIAILVMGSPVALLIKLPLQIIATVTDLIVDMALVVIAGITYWGTQFISAVAKLSASNSFWDSVNERMVSTATTTRTLAQGAVTRIGVMFMNSPLSPRPDYGRLSVNSHAALRGLQNTTAFALDQTSEFVGTVIERVSEKSLFQLVWAVATGLPVVLFTGTTTLYTQINSLLVWLWSSKSYKITFDVDMAATATVYTALERWTATDRMIAIFAGYACFAIAGAVYLRRGTPISSSQQGQRVELIISEILQQAGGVLKVILIISIEMLAFPLYCGLLLDLAMLPLFKNATLITRWQFTQESPWTSGFVHWFVGTCYMFHFALFVSMCRKIMRKGVLYFIRDPDDPTFHPVRDVLERSVTTQLRKIAFSALVYGALVIVCLGGVIWTLSRVTSNILPIHWTTEAPSLEFPLDLLFYNFLGPIIVKFYKPNESVHSVYKWWFKKCAGVLNLSNFLFGEDIEQHEGQPGKYVRAPASDQARIPKGQRVFVEVDKDNNRMDGQNTGGVHNNLDLVTMVFIPSWFRLRVFAFVVTIWIFMGLSGVSVTIMPLLFGRYLFSLVFPPSVEINDIHAFSLGVYTLGSLTYSAYHLYNFFASLDRPVLNPTSTLSTILTTTSRVGLRILTFTYVWACLIFLIPTLFAILIELYLLMPLHAYLGPSEPHVVHLIQDWTLGFLYARLAVRFLFANRNSRPARAFNAVIRNGYLHPNPRIATRCFIAPIVAAWLVAIAVPASLAWTTSRTLYRGADEKTAHMLWRFSFPAVGMSLVAMWAAVEAGKMLQRWNLVVRDEVYLIGERLHNFGERKAGVQSRAVEAEWASRAGEGVVGGGGEEERE